MNRLFSVLSSSIVLVSLFACTKKQMPNSEVKDVGVKSDSMWGNDYLLYSDDQRTVKLGFCSGDHKFARDKCNTATKSYGQPREGLDHTLAEEATFQMNFDLLLTEEEIPAIEASVKKYESRAIELSEQIKPVQAKADDLANRIQTNKAQLKLLEDQIAVNTAKLEDAKADLERAPHNHQYRAEVLFLEGEIASQTSRSQTLKDEIQKQESELKSVRTQKDFLYKAQSDAKHSVVVLKKAREEKIKYLAEAGETDSEFPSKRISKEIDKILTSDVISIGQSAPVKGITAAITVSKVERPGSPLGGKTYQGKHFKVTFPIDKRINKTTLEYAGQTLQSLTICESDTIGPCRFHKGVPGFNEVYFEKLAFGGAFLRDSDYVLVMARERDNDPSTPDKVLFDLMRGVKP